MHVSKSKVTESLFILSQSFSCGTAEIKITPAHPAWVGAWWIGLLVGCLLILIAGFPMWFYPKHLKKEEVQSILGF